MSLSSITFSGTLREDPEVRSTPSNIPVTNFKLEVCYLPRNFSSQGSLFSEVVRVNAWRDLAGYCEKLKKGDKILVYGRPLMNSFMKNGKKKRVLEIDATSVVQLKNILSIKLPDKPQSADDELESTQYAVAPKNANGGEFDNDFLTVEEITNTEEIPF